MYYAALCQVTTAQEAFQLVAKGNKVRAVGSTQCNDVSSRCVRHFIVQYVTLTSCGVTITFFYILTDSYIRFLTDLLKGSFCHFFTDLLCPSFPSLFFKHLIMYRSIRLLINQFIYFYLCVYLADFFIYLKKSIYSCLFLSCPFLFHLFSNFRSHAILTLHVESRVPSGTGGLSHSTSPHTHNHDASTNRFGGIQCYVVCMLLFGISTPVLFDYHGFTFS